ncbi:snRNA-activating protein complex subunit 2 [Cololabis saira]|uniref:snRNA-activating protein complex subunit 2 n=1 Tax=Cololabis saira TaxID=129043 RepID=UPI002AD4635F|nr:snRNA-activating protein complex subunit 2 [Cololabis saira]
MKPPPRTRTRTPRVGQRAEPEPRSLYKEGKWGIAERRRLLSGLKRLSGAGGGKRDLDYGAVKRFVPTRSLEEVTSVLDSLVNQVISYTGFKLQTRSCKERKSRKPIEEWMHMASVVAGTLEETVTSPFNQVLMVSSTEPCTLRNCDLPLVGRPASDNDSSEPNATPCRAARAQVQGRPFLMFKTPAPTKGPARRLPAPSQVVVVKNLQTCPPQRQLPPAAGTLSVPSFTSPTSTVAGQVSSPTAGPSAGAAPPAISSTAATRPTTEQHPGPVSEPSSSSQLPSTSRSVPTSLPSAVTSSSTATTTPAGSSGFKQKSKRVSGAKFNVDFEKIYNFLSAAQKPKEGCRLTPMESAIVLDLLMSLPEELALLDCKSLRKHLIQMHRFLSAPADSRTAAEMSAKVRNRLSSGGGEHGAPGVGPTDRQRVKEQPQNQASGRSSCLGRPAEGSVSEACPPCPPLNPFMVPLKLLRRKPGLGLAEADVL